MINLDCPECGETLDIEDAWDFEGACPKCGILLVCAYDEIYDADSGEESGWHFLERK